MTDKCICALHGYQTRDLADKLENALSGKVHESFISIYADNLYDRIIKLEAVCGANMETTRSALYKMKEYIDRKQYPYASDILQRIRSDIRNESIEKNLRKC